jgi:Na+/glutamate symporter
VIQLENFGDFSVWGTFALVATLLISLLVANVLKKTIKFLHASLIPTSVLGGIILVGIGVKVLLEHL